MWGLTSKAENRRLLIIATLGGGEAEVDLREILSRRLMITGSTLRSRTDEFKSSIAAELRLKV